VSAAQRPDEPRDSTDAPAAEEPTQGTAASAAATPAAAPESTPVPHQGVPIMRQQRRVEGPRRIKNGLRLRRKEGIDNLPWPASGWLQRLLPPEGPVDPLIRAEGLDYAKAGQVASLTITPGLVDAVIQGRAPRPYRVRVEVATLSAQEWERIVSIMAAEAIWSAKLLSGELPIGVEALFRSLDRTLVPTNDAEVRTSCTCQQFTDLSVAGENTVCKHLAAAWAMVMERVDIDPLLSFTLRGLDGQRLLERLQEARAIATRGVSKAHSTPPVAEAAPALPPVERCLEDFWRPGRRLGELEELHPEEHVPHALLRRLGPSPFQANANRAAHVQAAPAKGMPALPPPATNQPMSKFPLVGLLASIYDSIAQASRKLRDSEG
jgi:uncharacterized Zn finger protein